MILERARAKVNLTLRVLGRRTDGYHEIDSLIAFAGDAFDLLSLDPGAPTGVTVSGPFAGHIVGENIVATALRRLAEMAPELTLGAVQIDKRLPVAAGIGGGSANAGALLRALAATNLDNAADIDWLELAASLGADVPVCFVGQPCRVTGLGERLEPLPRLPSLNAVLVNSLAKVPADKTARVFRQLTAPAMSESIPVTPAPGLENSEALLKTMSEIGNDLEPPARRAFPEIADVLDTLHATNGCRFAAMSGAGPTCFGSFDDHQEAAANIASRHPDWWVQPSRI